MHGASDEFFLDSKKYLRSRNKLTYMKAFIKATDRKEWVLLPDICFLFGISSFPLIVSCHCSAPCSF